MQHEPMQHVLDERPRREAQQREVPGFRRVARAGPRRPAARPTSRKRRHRGRNQRDTPPCRARSSTVPCPTSVQPARGSIFFIRPTADSRSHGTFSLCVSVPTTVSADASVHRQTTYKSSARTPMQCSDQASCNPCRIALLLAPARRRAAPSRCPASRDSDRIPCCRLQTHTLIPTVHVAAAVGWPQGTQPQAGPGMTVNAFASGLDHPRWLYVLPNGDVLVAETNAPPQPADSTGIKNRVMRLFMKKAGAATPSANRITLLRDTDGDGVADLRSAFLEGLNSPFGMALVGSDFYVADTDAVLRFPYQPGQQHIDDRGRASHRPSRRAAQSSLDERPDRERGRQQAVCDRGLEQQRRRARHGREAGRAAIWEIDAAQRGAPRVRVRPAQREWPRMGTRVGRAVDDGQRARRTRRRPRPGLHDRGA